MNTSAKPVDKHRMAGLQDGVYAIAMTLLVLELKLPALPAHVHDAQVWAALLALWPKALTWLLSFWVLGVFWMSDVRALAVYATLDRLLARLTLWRLALVSLLPFSTALMGEHGDLVPSSAVYAAHIAALALLNYARFEYMYRDPNLLASGIQSDIGTTRIQAIAPLAGALVALGLAFVVPGYNMLALLPALAFRVGKKVKQHPIRPDLADTGHS